MMQIPYRIYGASGHSKVIIEMLEKQGECIDGLYDDDSGKTMLFEYKISHDNSIFTSGSVYWIIGIGHNGIRKKIAETHLLNYQTVIDKSANISQRASIGKGSVIMPGTTINASSILGKHSIVNTNASVDHDCFLGDYVHVSPNATLCGGVTVGEGTHIGAGAVIIPGIKIGKWAKIGAGSILIKNIPDNVTVVGNPGRINYYKI